MISSAPLEDALALTTGALIINPFVVASPDRWLLITEIAEQDPATGTISPVKIRVLETQDGGETFTEFNFQPECNFRQSNIQIAPNEWLFTTGSRTVRMRFQG